MPTRWNTFLVECGGGLVTNLPPIKQGRDIPGSAANLVNFEPNIGGGYRRINGYVKFSENVVPNTGQILGVGFLDGTALVVRNDGVYSSAGGAWATETTGRSGAARTRFDTINLDGTRKLIGTDGVNYPFSFDGTTWTELSGTTDILGASHAVEFKDHIFYATGNLVSITVPFDENNFSVADGAGQFRVPNNVTGMIVFRERLFIFTETEIRVIDGDDVTSWRLTSVTEGIGCIHTDTIQEVGGDVMFLASDGLRLLGATDRFGDFSNAVVAKEIQEEVNSFSTVYDQYASVVIRSKSQYRIMGWTTVRDPMTAEGIIGTNLTGFVQTRENDGWDWGELVGVMPYSAASEVYNGDEFVLFCTNDDYIYRLDQNTSTDFDGVAIPSAYWTPFFTMDDPRVRKTIYSLNIYGSYDSTASGMVSLRFNQGSQTYVQPDALTFSGGGGGALYGQAYYDQDFYASAGDSEIRILTVGAGLNVQFRFDFTENNDPFTIETLAIEYSLEDRR